MSESLDVSNGNNDAEFWRLVLESHQQSGLNVSQFCRREGISTSSFYNWQKRLKSNDENGNGVLVEPGHNQGLLDNNSRPTFLEVSMIKDSGSPLRITFSSGACIHAEGNCDVKLLREAIGILVEKRC